MHLTSPTAKNFPSELNDTALAALIRSLLDHDLFLPPGEFAHSDAWPVEKGEDMPAAADPNGE